MGEENPAAQVFSGFCRDEKDGAVEIAGENPGDIRPTYAGNYLYTLELVSYGDMSKTDWNIVQISPSE